MGIGGQTPHCGWHLDQFQQVEGTFVCRVIATSLVADHGLGNLSPHRIGRIQGCHRLLKDHGYCGAADIRQLRGRESQHVTASDADGSGQHCFA